MDNKRNLAPALSTILKGEATELTEEEIALLFDYRLSDKESRKEIQAFIESFDKQKKELF